MDILPAIDIRSGKVVRLSQGDYERQTVYADDAVKVAEEFVSAGARWIHMVDLDAARSGAPTNTGVVAAVCRAIGSRAHVQFGGGLRRREAIDTMIGAGVSRLVIGSAALKDWPWFEQLLGDAGLGNDHLALGLDARDGRLAAEGWTESSAQTAVELAGRVRGSGLGAIVYTDIARDGMLTGPNLPATADVIAATDVPVIASGGMSGMDDLVACRQAACAGAIVGRAYYEGKIDLAAACRRFQD